MFHPTRGGTRGGKDQFTWESVKTDKDRECYLGHSVMAPVGRWQQGKDITWYASNKSIEQAKKQNDEFQKAKEIEENTLMAALGYRVIPKSQQMNNSANNETVHKNTRGEKIKDSSSNKKTKKNKDKYFKSKNKKYLDRVLMKLVKRNGIDKVLDALSDSKSSKKRKHKKHHSKSKKSKRDSSSSSDSD